MGKDTQRIKEKLINEQLKGLKNELLNDELKDVVEILETKDSRAFKHNVKQAYNKYLNEKSLLDDKYKDLDSDEYKRTYSEEYLKNKWIEKMVESSEIRTNSEYEVDKALRDYKRALAPDMDTINSIEYQTKLSNTLNLMNLVKGNVDVSMLDFVVEARDMNTLSLIQNGYEDNLELKNYARNNSIDMRVEEAEKLAADFSKAITDKTDYETRCSIYNIENL